MTKRMRITVIALMVVFGGIVFFNLLKGFMIKRFFATYTPPAVTVSSVTAVQKDWSPRLLAVGNFVAMNGVDVNAQASGTVVAIHFTSGQYVKAGTPLIDIDDVSDQAILKAKQSDLVLQGINYKRQLDLAKHGATPSSSVDEAQAKLLQAQAEVERVQSLVSDKHIKAPFSGQLGLRQVDLGQYIIPGQTTITSLQSMDPLYLNFYLPEQLFKHVHINQTVTFSTDQNHNLLFEGKITAINSKIDTDMHNIKIQATLPNCSAKAIKDPAHSPLIKLQKQPDSDKLLVTCNTELNQKDKIERFNLIPGMFASLEIKEKAKKNVIVIPTTAISYSLYGNSVYVIEKEKDKKDKKDSLIVKRVFVNTGEQQGNDTVILSGIKAGQQIVSAGELKLQDGTHVAIDNSVRLDKTLNLDDLGE